MQGNYTVNVKTLNSFDVQMHLGVQVNSSLKVAPRVQLMVNMEYDLYLLLDGRVE